MHTSSLARHLRAYALDRGKDLSKAIGVQKEHASRLLNGERYGVRISQRIATALRKRGFDVAWHTVYEWQEDHSGKG
jgi:hypothetical protein